MGGERGERKRGKGGRGEGIGRWGGGEGEGEEGKGALMPACLVSKTVTCRPPASAVPIVYLPFIKVIRVVQQFEDGDEILEMMTEITMMKTIMMVIEVVVWRV